MKNKFLIAILTIFTFIFTSLGVVGCTKPKEVNIVGFDDFTTTAHLNEDFSYGSYLMAVDENDNKYLGTAEVFDEENNSVKTAYNIRLL